MRTTQLPEEHTVLAPDGSEIRELLATTAASVVHCTLHPGTSSAAVRHRTVHEIWFFIEGTGQVWRRDDDGEEVTDVGPGTSLDIPTGAHFQFRATGARALRFLIVTLPPWPGEHEAVRVPGYWKDSPGA